MRREGFGYARSISLRLAQLKHLAGREATELDRVARLQVVMLIHTRSSAHSDASRTIPRIVQSMPNHTRTSQKSLSASSSQAQDGSCVSCFCAEILAANCSINVEHLTTCSSCPTLAWQVRVSKEIKLSSHSWWDVLVATSQAGVEQPRSATAP